jgi:hypothetical protein
VTCAAMTLWLAAQTALGVGHWLGTKPEVIRLLACLGWLGPVSVAIPIARRKWRDSTKTSK